MENLPPSMMTKVTRKYKRYACLRTAGIKTSRVGRFQRHHCRIFLEGCHETRLFTAIDDEKTHKTLTLVEPHARFGTLIPSNLSPSFRNTYGLKPS